MVAGRPGKLFTDEEVVALGKDLLAWLESKEGKNNLMWVDWFYNKHNMFRDDFKSLVQRKEFFPYYEVARQIMAKNIVLNNKIAQSYGNRYLAKYDDELLDHEESIKDRDVKRGKELSQNVNVEQLNSLAACLERFSQKRQISEDKVVEADHSESPPSQERGQEVSRDQ